MHRLAGVTGVLGVISCFLFVNFGFLWSLGLEIYPPYSGIKAWGLSFFFLCLLVFLFPLPLALFFLL